MFAVIETGGKQYKIENGSLIYIEKLDAAEDEIVEFPVVAYSDEQGLKLGKPYVKGVTVKGRIVKNGKQKKITVFTYKPKKNAKRKMGHRQPYTMVRIESVDA